MIRCFNPHPIRRLGATYSSSGYRLQPDVSIPTQSEDWVQRGADSDDYCGGNVSIPTQSEDWVQPARLSAYCTSFRVSIPTQSEDWVQPSGNGISDVRRMFQSPPNPKIGCNFPGIPGWCSSEQFQSPPNPKIGCNHPGASHNTRRCSFNPHPIRRLGATGQHCGWRHSHRVSIPTQSEDWVQRGYMRRRNAYSLFQSPPNPKIGCNSAFSAASWNCL